MSKIKEYNSLSLSIEMYKEYWGDDEFNYITVFEDISGQHQCNTSTFEKFNQTLSYFCKDENRFNEISDYFQDVFQ